MATMIPRVSRPLGAGLMILAILPCAASAQGDADLERYITPADIPVRVLDAEESFAGLTEREKLYAHWMSVASWMGCLITFEQVSFESPLRATTSPCLTAWPGFKSGGSSKWPYIEA